jgi:UDP-glucose 4-epimerase
MGGELGSRVTALLERRADVSEIVGCDVEPPRGRLHRADFHLVDPRDRRRLVRLVADVEPTAVVHLGVYEPYARSGPHAAAQRTTAVSIAVLGAAAELGGLERVVVRSGIEVYGRRRGALTRPDERVAPDPTSVFGASLLQVEAVAAEAGATAGVPVTALRFAPIAGPHFPSPLGRLLRLPAVPVGAWSNLPFSLLHPADAADAVVAALASGHDGPVNVVGGGAVTADQAARLGGRIPVPVSGPGWAVARRLAELAGAPIPDHVQELLVRGRVAEGARVAELLGVAPQRSTLEIVKELHDWATVHPLRPTEEAA